MTQSSIKFQAWSTLTSQFVCCKLENATITRTSKDPPTEKLQKTSRTNIQFATHSPGRCGRGGGRRRRGGRRGRRRGRGGWALVRSVWGTLLAMAQKRVPKRSCLKPGFASGDF